MKRSVNNQVTTQSLLACLMSNTFFQPLFAWRIIIGPITPWLSIFASVVSNIFANWMGVCLTQMAVFKVSKCSKGQSISRCFDVFNFSKKKEKST